MEVGKNLREWEPGPQGASRAWLPLEQSWAPRASSEGHEQRADMPWLHPLCKRKQERKGLLTECGHGAKLQPRDACLHLQQSGPMGRRAKLRVSTGGLQP